MYILDNKPDNVNEIEILKFMACNEYPAHIRKDLKDILSKKIGSDNWVSRQKVLLFCKVIWLILYLIPILLFDLAEQSRNFL